MKGVYADMADGSPVVFEDFARANAAQGKSPRSPAANVISMITEIARITIDPANAAAFEAAVRQSAETVQSRAPGCRGLRLEQVVENPAVYLLFCEWDTVEHHTITFRESPLFSEWRALAGPFFVETPAVEHTRLVGRFL